MRAVESALVGALLVDPSALAAVRPLLQPADFATRAGAVYAAACALADRGQPADYVLLEAELERTGQLAAVGGPVALLEAVLRCPTSLHATAYATAVAAAARARRKGQLAGSQPQLRRALGAVG